MILSALGGLWRRRWGIARLLVALALLATFLADHPARMLRLQLAAMGEVDYLAEAATLRNEGRFVEAELVLSAGIENVDAEQRPALVADLQRTIEQRNSIVRRAREFAGGALLGAGDSLESLLGAISADFFVVGDVRDLLIQGSRWIANEEVDELVAGLSAVGLATTVTPQFDAAASVVKLAQRTGRVTNGLADAVRSLARRAVVAGDWKPLRAVVDDVGTLAAKGSPAFALRILKHADEPADLARAARFSERNVDGAFSLMMTGPEGVRALRSAGATADDAIRAVAKRGPAARRWLAQVDPRIFRPHPIVGILKSLQKGNAQRAAARVVEAIDPQGWWIIPGLAAWVFLEAAAMLRGARVRSTPQP